MTKPGAGVHSAAVTALLVLLLLEPESQNRAARELPQPPSPGTLPRVAGNQNKFAHQVFCEFPMGQGKNEGVNQGKGKGNRVHT